jgi:outer membrane receptor protein involved in Fe transport
MGRLTSLNYNVSQPIGQLSPFSPIEEWTDADNFARNFTAGQSGIYAEISGTFGTRWSVIAAVREETFALTGSSAFEPRASAAFRVNEHQSISASFNRASQLPPTINILSYPQNSRLLPVEDQQVAVAAEMWRGNWGTISTEAYRKRYWNEPVSTEYPSLMLANMVDTLGQQFVWLPLRTGGKGHSQGIELSIRAHAADRLRFLGSLTYSRTFYAAGDGIMRAGNFDFPVVGSGMATLRLPAKFQLSVRNTYATGRPYTPFDIALSEEQARGIYDLTQINATRGSAYNRLDADFNRSIRIRGKGLNLYGGLENALNRQNFLGMAWEDNCSPPQGAIECGENVNAIPGVPETRVDQMPRFPSAGARFVF